MEKCPHCEKETIEVKKKLALSPRDVLICPNCGTKLGLASYTYFIHAIYMLIIGLALFKLPLLIGIGAVVISSILALVLLVKVIPFKIIH